MKNLLKQLSSLILPITVLVIVPWAIENRWVVTVDILSVAGFMLVAGGGALLVGTVALLIRKGSGTLAPWSPTQKLVVRGLYAHTRNPMITGVLTVLLGESAVFHSMPVFIWCVSFFVINNVYFVFSEEPGLEKRFGEEYREYKKNVPRWLPRVRAWVPPNTPPSS